MLNASAGAAWGCAHVASGSAVSVSPPGLAEACGFAPPPAPAPRRSALDRVALGGGNVGTNGATDAATLAQLAAQP